MTLWSPRSIILRITRGVTLFPDVLHLQENLLGYPRTLEMEDILELLNSEAIDITVSDSHIAEIWSSVFENINILNHLRVRKGGKIAWMVRKNNPELKSSLNQFIKTHKKGTLLGNIFFNRYYKNNKWIRNPLAHKEHKKILYYVDLFKKYANKYRK